MSLTHGSNVQVFFFFGVVEVKDSFVVSVTCFKFVSTNIHSIHARNSSLIQLSMGYSIMLWLYWGWG